MHALDESHGAFRVGVVLDDHVSVDAADCRMVGVDAGVDHRYPHTRDGARPERPVARQVGGQVEDAAPGRADQVQTHPTMPGAPRVLPRLRSPAPATRPREHGHTLQHPLDDRALGRPQPARLRDRRDHGREIVVGSGGRGDVTQRRRDVGSLRLHRARRRVEEQPAQVAKGAVELQHARGRGGEAGREIERRGARAGPCGRAPTAPPAPGRRG